MNTTVTTAAVLALLVPVASACAAHQPAHVRQTMTPTLTQPAPARPTPLTARTSGYPSADEAALRGVEALQAFDTTIDTNPNDTARRAAAAGLLTGGFAAAVEAFRFTGSGGAAWAGWTRHRAYVRVAAWLGGDDHPPDSPSSAYRQVIATLTPVGRDGWTGTSTTKVVAVTLARGAGGMWRVASFTST